MLGILALIALVCCLICLIIVLIKQFQNGGVVHGIIGIITCGLWTFIWGWMNSGKLNLRNIMMIWTLLFVVYCILLYMSGGFSYRFGSLPTT